MIWKSIRKFFSSKPKKKVREFFIPEENIEEILTLFDECNFHFYSRSGFTIKVTGSYTARYKMWKRIGELIPEVMEERSSWEFSVDNNGDYTSPLVRESV